MRSSPSSTKAGREIGRVVAEGGLGRKKPARLVLCDRRHTAILVVVRAEEQGEAV